MQMPEIEREEILAQRAEEKRKYEENFKLNQLAQQQSNGDAVAAAAKSMLQFWTGTWILIIAKGKHTQRGATKTKSDKLAELKAKRKAKDDRKKVRWCFFTSTSSHVL